jgi:class 3 adenylate cyclase/tetratricopeptide (TPR) repeat protein
MATELPEGTVTVLFTDLVDSTALTNRVGDERARALGRDVEEIVRERVERHRGIEVKGLGDGQMVAFTSARRAVLCAVDIQKGLERWRRSDAQRADLALRIGLHTGEVIREEADLFGATVNFAARVAAQAAGGEVLLSEAAKAVLGAAPSITLEERAEVELKGFPGHWRLYAVAWEPEPEAGPAPGTVPLAGRDTERSVLSGAIARAKEGHGAIVLLAGEPGVGKTRLATEAMAEARQSGFLTVIGHCYETDGTPPFVPFVEALDEAFRDVPRERLEPLLGEEGPEVARIAPRLRAMFPALAPAADLPPEQARHYLFSCIGTFLARAAAARPTLLVLDDLHWADESTVLLFEHLASRIADVPMLIVGTYRDTDLDTSRPFAGELSRLSRLPVARRLPVRRLDRDGVAVQLRGLSGKDVPAALIDVIARETEGVPLFTQELYRYLAEQGRLFDESGDWRAVEVGEVEVPEGVRLVIGRRLERLSEPARRVLTQASVVGRDFGFRLLGALTDMDEDTVLDAIEEAEAAHLLVPRAGREASYAFSHEQVRQTLLGTLSLPRRQRLHLRIADALESTYGSDAEAHASEIAGHLYQAGAAADPDRTVRFLILAADVALAAGGFEAALRWCDEAISLVNSDEPRSIAPILDRRARSLRSLGRGDEALAVRETAAVAWEQLGDRDAAAEAWSEQAFDLFWLNLSAESLSAARRGLEVLGGQDSPHRCLLLAAEAASLAWLPGGDPAGLDNAFETAERLAESVGDARMLGLVLQYRSDGSGRLGLIRRGAQSAIRAASVLTDAGQPYEATSALTNAITWNLLAGRLDLVDQAHREMAPLRRFGHAGAYLPPLSMVSLARLMRDGELKAYLTSCAAALDEAMERRDAFSINFAHLYLATGERWAGKWDDAQARLGRFGPAGRPYQAAAAISIATLRGDLEDVSARLDESRDLLPQPVDALTAAERGITIAVAEAIATLRSRDGAKQLYEVVQVLIANGMILDPSFGLAERAAALAARADGDFAAAEAHFETALRQAHEIPHRIEQPEVRRWYGDMLIDRNAPGDRDRAITLLDEAEAMYRELGMLRHFEPLGHVRARL